MIGDPSADCEVSERQEGLCTSLTAKHLVILAELVLGVIAFRSPHSKLKGRKEEEGVGAKKYNENARKTFNKGKPLHCPVCQNHCCLPITEEDCPPLEAALVLFTEFCLVRPGKSHKLAAPQKKHVIVGCTHLDENRMSMWDKGLKTWKI